jgi:hypothetical protein
MPPGRSEFERMLHRLVDEAVACARTEVDINGEPAREGGRLSSVRRQACLTPSC